jgi:hypothetical protein
MSLARPNSRLLRTPSTSPPSTLSCKPVGAVVKIRAGGRRVARAWSRASQAMRSPSHSRFNGRPHGLNARSGTLRG